MSIMKKCFIILMMLFVSFIIFNGDKVSATVDNFASTSEKVIIENDPTYPFIDAIKDEENVIKSTNSEQNSTSTLKITFSGAGELSFDIFTSSEQGCDFLFLIVDGRVVRQYSGNSEDWTTITLYNEDPNSVFVLEIQYYKDSSVNRYDDCIYLKNLKLNETLYAPYLDFELDGNTYTDVKQLRYDLVNSNSVIKFNDVDSSYNLTVSLNGQEVVGNNYEYNLKSNLKYNNKVEIKYSVNGYRERVIEFSYNVNLKYVLGEHIEYSNSEFSLYDYDSSIVIKSNDCLNNETVVLDLQIDDSGEFSFDYLVSGRKDFDYFIVEVNGEEVYKYSGINSSFETFNYVFYRNNNSVKIIYSKNNNDYIVGDDCVYLKNFNFVSKAYAPVENIYLNDFLVDDRAGYVKESSVSDYYVTVSDFNDVDFFVYLNDVLVSGIDGKYILNNLSIDNEIRVVFSKDGCISRDFVFYLYNQNLDLSIGNVVVNNDVNNPYIIKYYDGERVVSSNVYGINDVQTEISFVVKADGVFSFDYMISTEKYCDFFIMYVNDVEMFKYSGVVIWSSYEINLKYGDVVKFVYSKDYSAYSEEDSVYLRNIKYIVKNYAAVKTGKINNASFNSLTEILEFDYSNKNSVLTFDNLEDSSVVVKVNGEVVLENNNEYDLTSYLSYSNLISIEYSEVGYDSYVLEFYYNAKLSNLEYKANPAYVLNDENSITLNDFDSFEDEILRFNVYGSGIFSFSYDYFTYSNLSVTACFDEVCFDLFANNSINELNYFTYYFDSNADHVVEFRTDSKYYVGGIDYFNVKNINFITYSNLADLIVGDGSENNAFDYSAYVSYLDNIHKEKYEISFINESILLELYLKEIVGYTLYINDVAVEFNNSISKVNLNTVGKNVIRIVSDDCDFSVIYYNQGLYGSSITVGYGSQENPYEITNEEQLRDISKGLEYYYILKNDITLTSNWVSIGSEEEPFTGGFDGGNYKISNLVIDTDSIGGLFAFANKARIVNLVIENARVVNANVVGTLIGVGEDVYVGNVVIDVDINVNIGDVEESAVGGAFGVLYRSNVYNVEVSGNIVVEAKKDTYSVVGGISGYGGNIFDSVTSVNVTGNGYVGGVIGVCDYECSISNVILEGNVILSENKANEYGLGIFTVDYDSIEINNVKHIIKGVYTSSSSIYNAYLFSQGIDSNGIEINLSNNSFELEISLVNDSVNNLNIKSALSNGYVIRFEMWDESYKYVEIFDRVNNQILSILNINLDDYTSYSVSDISVNNYSSKYYEEEYKGQIMSSYLNIFVDDIKEFNHVSVIINYGVPVRLGVYKVASFYCSRLNIILNGNLDFTNNYLYSLGYSKYSPYVGLIEGNNNKIILDNNQSFVNYLSDDAKIENIIIEGHGESLVHSVIDGNVVFKNVISYANNVDAAFVKESSNSSITFENCENYGSFKQAAFYSGIGRALVTFVGVNKNYGEFLDDVKRSGVEIFVGVGTKATFTPSSLENYYILDVKESNVSLIINFNEYVSNEDGLIIFITDSNVVTISNDLLRQTKVTLSNSLRDEFLVAKSLEISQDSLYSNSKNEYNIEGVVEFYGGSKETVYFDIDFSNIDFNSNELVFYEVNLMHNTYLPESYITLYRTTELIEEYVECFKSLNNSNEGIKEKLEILVSKYEELKAIYSEGNVSEESIEYFYSFLSINEASEERINEWLSIVIDYAEALFDPSLVYGDMFEGDVLVVFLDGHVEILENVLCDYSLSDINGENIRVTSVEKIEKNVDNKIFYSDYISFDAKLVKRKVYADVSNYVFEYTGQKVQLDINVLNLASKFNDSVVSVEVINRKDNEIVEAIDVGVYSSEATIVITNNEYYDFSEFVLEDIVIKIKTVTLTWSNVDTFTYDGNDKIDYIYAYYLEGNSKVYVEFDELEMINAGSYMVSAKTGDNLQFVNGFNIYNVEKANFSVSMGDYVMQHMGEFPTVEFVTKGLVNGDIARVNFEVVKDDVVYDDVSSLDVGEYSLNISVTNLERLENNYNIELINGRLVVDGRDTYIVVESNSYDYSGEQFNSLYVKAKVYDEFDEFVADNNFSYKYYKNGIEVDGAIDVGEYEVLITFNGNSYCNKSSILINLTINVVDVDIVINNSNSEYGNEDAPLTYSFLNNIMHSRDLDDIVLTREEGNEIGVYTVSGEYKGSNYNVNFSNGIYIINRRRVVIKIDDQNSNYFENEVPLTYSIEQGSFFEEDQVEITLFKEFGNDVGEYEIDGICSSSKYEVEFIKGKYTINKGNITNITFNDSTVAYTGQAIEFSVSSNLLSDGSEAEITYIIKNDVFDIIYVGEYEVEATITNPNYNTLVLTSKITVVKGENPIKYSESIIETVFSEDEYDYKIKNTIYPDHTVAEISYTIFKDNKVVSKITDVGEYLVAANIVDLRGNYKDSISSAKVIVTPKPILIQYIGQKEYTYNGRMQGPVVPAASNVNYKYSTETGGRPISVGKYSLIVNSKNSNYIVENDVFEFEIKPIEITVSDIKVYDFEYNASRIYGKVDILNVINNEDVYIDFYHYYENSFIEYMSDVGEYSLRFNGLLGEDKDNYVLNIENNEVTCNVVKKNIVILPLETSKEYLSEDVEILFFYQESLFNDDTFTGHLAREEGENVGEYKILLGTLDAGKNYNLIVSDRAVYTITPKVISYSYDATNFVYDGQEKKLNVNIDGEAHVEYVGDLINAGSYIVKIVVDNDNYCLSEDYRDIVVNIAKRDISDVVSLNVSQYTYSKQTIVPDVSCGQYDCYYKYYYDNKEIGNVINPGNYKVRVMIDLVNEKADVYFDFVINKANREGRDFNYEVFYNRIVIEDSDDLMYSIDGVNYYDDNTFTSLEELSEYEISVIVKEDKFYYSSSPVKYVVTTSADPRYVNYLIDNLSDEFSEKNLMVLKKIEKELELVNYKDIDEEKYEKYMTLKEAYQQAIGGYREDIGTVNKVSKNLEDRIIFVSSLISSLVVLFVLRKKFNV